MFVINFDFTQHGFFHKLAAINIPVFLTEIITYPLQRIQTQLIRKQGYHNQVRQIPKILGEMVRVEGFPKCYHGFRYSLDYSITQMTFKFFLFDHIASSTWTSNNKISVYLGCILANAIGTFASQSAFNYQTIASSLEPSRNNTTESIALKLIQFTKNKKAFRNGLKYTLPISIINSFMEVFIITKLEGRFLSSPQQSDNYLAPTDPGYAKQQLLIAAIVLAVTSITNHFVIQRQIQLCFDRKERYNYLKGFTGTLLRNMGKGMVLYCIYYKYFDWMYRREVEDQFQKKQVHNILPKYYESRGRTSYAKQI